MVFHCFHTISTVINHLLIAPSFAHSQKTTCFQEKTIPLIVVMHLACTQTLGDEGVNKFMIAQNNETWLVINYVIFFICRGGECGKKSKSC